MNENERNVKNVKNAPRWATLRATNPSQGTLCGSGFALQYVIQFIIFNNCSKKNDKPRKKGLNEVREMDYQIGKFKNGVQYLSKEDIVRLKRKAR